MVFISGNIPSSKNSKIATSIGVFHSKTVTKWLREQGILSYSVSKKQVQTYKTKQCVFPVTQLKELMMSAGEKTGERYPIKLGIHFVRNSKAKFDFHNICQIIMDIMVAFDIIEDDNMDCVLPFPMKIDDKWYSINKENPGCWITILN